MAADEFNPPADLNRRTFLRGAVGATTMTDSQDGFLRNSTHVLMDRDTKFFPLQEFL